MGTFKLGDLTANCGICGSSELKYEDVNNDASKIYCAKCDAYQGTIGSFKAAAEATAESNMPEIAKMLKKALDLK